MTVEELASRVGVANGARVTLWERGSEQPKPHLIPRLAKVLRVDPSSMLALTHASPDLSALRMMAGLSRDELAGAAHLSKMTYNRLERGIGVRGPSRSVVQALAAALGASEAAVLASIERSRRDAD